MDKFEQQSLFGDNPAYKDFTDKFKPKLTTDDCYTPPEVYDAVRDWACAEYGIDPAGIVRPFYPGGDYKRHEYPDGCTVLDNPPFSILTKICEFYLQHGIRFFLFAPGLTAFSSRNVVVRTTHIVCEATITYANGAAVNTAFVTNLGGDVIARTAPELRRAIEAAQKRAKQTKQMPKYEYPPHVLTAAMLQRYSKYGIDFAVTAKDCMPISKLDAQAGAGKAIFGGGLLLSERVAAERAAAERAAAERAAAERAAATVWELSERERRMVAALGVERDELFAEKEERA